MVTKDRRREDLHRSLKENPTWFERIYVMRCLVREGRTDVEKVEEILEVEYPNERTPKQIAKRKARWQKELDQAEQFVRQFLRDHDDHQR